MSRNSPNNSILNNIANWEIVRIKKQQSIHRNFMKENNRRKHFDWQPGMEIMLENSDGEKLSAKATGPFRIEKVHTNGTVTIKLKESGPCNSCK